MLTDEEREHIWNDLYPDGDRLSCKLDAYARAIERAVLAKAMPIPKQDPFAYCYTDVNGRAKELCESPDCQIPQDKRVITALYKEPQPAQAAAIPEGWQLVPVEPTPAMLKEIHLIDEFSERALIVRYKAMLSASPKPENTL